MQANQNSGLKLFVSYVTRYYRPAIVAWVLQRGVSYLVSGVRDPLADNAIGVMNAFIHHNLPNTAELREIQFSWWATFYQLGTGVLLVLLALALGMSMVPGSGPRTPMMDTEP